MNVTIKMEEQPAAETIMEERKETMVSPTGSDPFLKKAHFLKPTFSNSTNLLPLLSKPPFCDVKETPLEVTFKGRASPLNRWEKWVHLMLPKHKHLWKSAGIYDSILVSTYKIYPQQDLVIALAERWCIETNTFMFPWGESTITLEDMLILGGYAVTGFSVSTPLSSNETRETEKKLIQAHGNIKLSTGKKTGVNVWMDHFMNTSNELEHEAFLALWLSWFVFPISHPFVGKFVFPMAIRLAQGSPLALAPAVLASIYKDLTLLKKSILSSPIKEIITLFAPLKFLQIWVWERFPTLRPTPNPTGIGKPRIARWHKLKVEEIGDQRRALDSASDCFQWRPYCRFVDNWRFNEFYREKEEWVVVTGLDEEIDTYVTCVRPSELVGLGCQKQYLPHRVAMQFGFDQDIPGFVPRFNDTYESAWSNYTRPLGDKKVYIPARLYESDVTLRYSTWWDRAMLVKEDIIKDFVKRPRSKRRKIVHRRCWGLDYDQGDKKFVIFEDDDKLTINEMLKKANGSSFTHEKVMKTESEVALEARVSRLEKLVGVLAAEKVGLIKKLRSFRAQ